MKKSHVFLSVAFVITGLFYYTWTLPETQFLEEKVINVVDGDTLDLESQTRIRLKGINTPEKGDALAKEAQTFLEEATLNRTVKVAVAQKDRYGRSLGYVFVNQKNINEELLRNGLATLYYYEHDRYYADLSSAEETARTQQIGLWKESPDKACLKLLELKYTEEPKRCSNDELLRIENICEHDINVMIKDDATHIYEEILPANAIFSKSFSCIFNNDGDSVYVRDDKGLLIFYRY